MLDRVCFGRILTGHFKLYWGIKPWILAKRLIAQLDLRTEKCH